MLELFGISNLFLSKDNACNARATAPFGLGAPSLRSMEDPSNPPCWRLLLYFKPWLNFLFPLLGIRCFC